MIGIIGQFILGVYIPFSFVGNSRNTPISNAGGNVNYDYEISTFEITNAQYCAFLNCVATDNDDYKLWTPIMEQNFMGGIIKTFDSNHYHYLVKTGYENKPVIGVSWYNAILFVNWLNYNCDLIEEERDIQDFRPYFIGDRKGSSYDSKNLRRSPDARYWLPNIDEWQKSCYYEGDKWNYELMVDGANIYNTETGWAYPFPHIKDVGEGVTPSYYGTFDQLGNLAEWVENGNEQVRYAVGGSLIRPSNYARFGEREGDFPSKSIATFGLRICRTADSTKRRVAPNLDFVNEYKNLNQTFFQDRIAYDSNEGIYVLVDHPKNEGDIVNQYKGEVNYVYYISKYELTNKEYCNFLNSVAHIEDKFTLWDSNMEFSVCGGISRKNNSDGTFTYYCKTGFENRPVSYIGFYELARYANWLHFGCLKGTQVIGVTEGTKALGAYDTSDFESIRFGEKKVFRDFGRRNKGAKFWIPDEDEWYKAAYYDPEIVGNRKYHDYPTRTSDRPSPLMANYMFDNSYAVGPPFFVAEVNDYSSFPSYFGTIQQGGNVWEWTESWQYDVPGCRALRGGSWQYTEYGLNAINEDPGGINDKSYLFGGRLCKSYESDGFQEVQSSLTNILYKKIHLLSKRYLYTIICMLLFSFLLLCILSSVFIFKYLSNGRQN